MTNEKEREVSGEKTRDFDVWIDHDSAWPSNDEPDPDATFEARTAEQAAVMASNSGEFDCAFARGGAVRLLVRRKGERNLISFTMEPVVEYRVIDTEPVTLAELRGV